MNNYLIASAAYEAGFLTKEALEDAWLEHLIESGQGNWGHRGRPGQIGGSSVSMAAGTGGAGKKSGAGGGGMTDEVIKQDFEANGLDALSSGEDYLRFDKVTLGTNVRGQTILSASAKFVGGTYAEDSDRIVNRKLTEEGYAFDGRTEDENDPAERYTAITDEYSKPGYGVSFEMTNNDGRVSYTLTMAKTGGK